MFDSFVIFDFFRRIGLMRLIIGNPKNPSTFWSVFKVESKYSIRKVIPTHSINSIMATISILIIGFKLIGF